MQEFILSFMESFGYLAIVVLITLENIFPPIPSEIILTFGGFMTTYTSMNAIFVILVSIIGSLIGAIILYYIGRVFNTDMLKRFCSSKIGKILKVNEKDIDKASNWFESKGEYTVFFCRFIPILRSLISIPAGMNKMNFVKFIVYTFYGCFIWNSALTILGRAFGEAYPVIASYINKFSKVVLVLLFIIILFLIVSFIKSQRKK